MGRAHQESSLLRLFSICPTISLFSACLQELPTFILTRFVWPRYRRLAPSLKFISFFIGSIESLAFNYLVGLATLLESMAIEARLTMSFFLRFLITLKVLKVALVRSC
jgi:hypothetical protein